MNNYNLKYEMKCIRDDDIYIYYILYTMSHAGYDSMKGKHLCNILDADCQVLCRGTYLVLEICISMHLSRNFALLITLQGKEYIK